MSFQIKFDESSSRHIIELIEAPSFHHVLDGDYLSDEPSLQHGVWIVILLVPYSSTSLQLLGHLSRDLRQFQSSIQFGMKLFEDNTELINWSREFELGHADPVTLILINGEIEWKTVGYVSVGQIQSAAREIL